MARYAKGTSVSEGRSKEEIERTLLRFGADEFIYGRSDGRVMIGFRYESRAYRLQIGMPSAEDDDILYSPRELKKPRVEDRYIRTDAQIEKLLAQETRRRWRVLAAYLKALVVGVEEDVLTWEEALLPYALLDTGQTVAEVMLPRMAEAIESGRLSVELLPALGETGDAESRP